MEAVLENGSLRSNMRGLGYSIHPEKRLSWIIGDAKHKMFEDLIYHSSSSSEEEGEEKHMISEPAFPDNEIPVPSGPKIADNIKPFKKIIEGSDREVFLRNRKRTFEDNTSDEQLAKKYARPSYSPLFEQCVPDSPSPTDLSQFAISASALTPLDPSEQDEEEECVEEILTSFKSCKSGWWTQPEEPDEVRVPSPRNYNNFDDNNSPLYTNSNYLNIYQLLNEINHNKNKSPSFLDEERSALHKKHDGKKPLHLQDNTLCLKTNKPKVRKEYYYPKNSKTIYRWTCCGSQAKDHPDADDDI
jgi:hypothetical protein